MRKIRLIMALRCEYAARTWCLMGIFHKSFQKNIKDEIYLTLYRIHNNWKLEAFQNFKKKCLTEFITLSQLPLHLTRRKAMV